MPLSQQPDSTPTPAVHGIPVFDVADLQQIVWPPESEFPTTVHELMDLHDRILLKFMNNLFLRLIIAEEGGVQPTNEQIQAGITKSLSPSGLCHFMWRGKPVMEYVPAGYNAQGGWTGARVNILHNVEIIKPGGN